MFKKIVHSLVFIQDAFLATMVVLIIRQWLVYEFSDSSYPTTMIGGLAIFLFPTSLILTLVESNFFRKSSMPREKRRLSIMCILAGAPMIVSITLLVLMFVVIRLYGFGVN